MDVLSLLILELLQILQPQPAMMPLSAAHTGVSLEALICWHTAQVTRSGTRGYRAIRRYNSL